jgi:hypothetical protein
MSPLGSANGVRRQIASQATPATTRIACLGGRPRSTPGVEASPEPVAAWGGHHAVPRALEASGQPLAPMAVCHVALALARLRESLNHRQEVAAGSPRPCLSLSRLRFVPAIPARAGHDAGLVEPSDPPPPEVPGPGPPLGPTQWGLTPVRRPPVTAPGPKGRARHPRSPTARATSLGDVARAPPGRQGRSNVASAATMGPSESRSAQSQPRDRARRWMARTSSGGLSGWAVDRSRKRPIDGTSRPVPATAARTASNAVALRPRARHGREIEQLEHGLAWLFGHLVDLISGKAQHLRLRPTNASPRRSLARSWGLVPRGPTAGYG